ncbi:ParA family protein [Ruegeria sediminis]|uniref:ParA family protein n=1 Tax=Ruegeria sediminis TaxID=2583820 RepID=A0ABY2WS32_9RHOB|nr:ParA family protein [Ruegeria sediminis]TMV02599.1 ParA family protein [Ruegeria sediminis]
MAIISMANPKGGSGKTTCALLLATEIARRGGTVTLIDADPERWITKWGQLDDLPDGIQIVSDVTADCIIDKILDAQEQTQFVIVDLEGTANMSVVQAIGISDLVLVPTQGSTMDSQGGAKIIKLIRQQARALRREVPHTVVFTRTSAAIQTRSLSHVRELMAKAGIPTLRTSIVERAAFREVFAMGGDLPDLDHSQVSGVEKATMNAGEFADEVLAILKTQSQEVA